MASDFQHLSTWKSHSLLGRSRRQGPHYLILLLYPLLAFSCTDFAPDRLIISEIRSMNIVSVVSVVSVVTVFVSVVTVFVCVCLYLFVVSVVRSFVRSFVGWWVGYLVGCFVCVFVVCLLACLLVFFFVCVCLCVGLCTLALVGNSLGLASGLKYKTL